MLGIPVAFISLSLIRSTPLSCLIHSNSHSLLFKFLLLRGKKYPIQQFCYLAPCCYNCNLSIFMWNTVIVNLMSINSPTLYSLLVMFHVLYNYSNKYIIIIIINTSINYTSIFVYWPRLFKDLQKKPIPAWVLFSWSWELKLVSESRSCGDYWSGKHQLV